MSWHVQMTEAWLAEVSDCFATAVEKVADEVRNYPLVDDGSLADLEPVRTATGSDHSHTD